MRIIVCGIYGTIIGLAIRFSFGAITVVVEIGLISMRIMTVPVHQRLRYFSTDFPVSTRNRTKK